MECFVYIWYNFIDQHQKVGPSLDLNNLYFFHFVETVSMSHPLTGNNS